MLKWFVKICYGLLKFTSYIVLVAKMAIMNNSTSFFELVGFPSSMPKPSDNPPTLMQQGLSNSTTPIKFQKQEKNTK